MPKTQMNENLYDSPALLNELFRKGREFLSEPENQKKLLWGAAGLGLFAFTAGRAPKPLLRWAGTLAFPLIISMLEKKVEPARARLS